MDKKKLSEVDKSEVLSALPEDIRRIQVTTEEGEVKFRKIDEVRWEDTINFNKRGQPIVMRGESGRPKSDDKEPIPSFGEVPKDPTVYVPVTRTFKPSVSKPTPTPSTKIQSTIDLSDDKILGIVRQAPESVDVLHHVMQGLAEEAAAMAYQRTLLQNQGKNTSNVSAKRVTALRAVGDTWLKRKEQIGSAGVDLNSPSFKRVFSFVMDTFRSSLMVSGIRPEQIEVIFAKLATKLDDDWMKEAQKRIDGDD